MRERKVSELNVVDPSQSDYVVGVSGNTGEFVRFKVSGLDVDVKGIDEESSRAQNSRNVLGGNNVNSAELGYVPTGLNIYDFRNLVKPLAGREDVEDWAFALQAAIDDIKKRCEQSGSIFLASAILIPPGVYYFSRTIKTYPWISIVAQGGVLFSWEFCSNGIVGFSCDNDTSLKWDVYKFASNSYWLNGIYGRFVLRGPARARNASIAIKMGNFSKGLKAFRTTGISNVWIGQWNVGVELGAYDTYLISSKDIVFENNIVNLKSSSGKALNSGEKCTWLNCVFGPCETQFIHDIDGLDVNFHNCSFDFQDNVIVLGENSRYARIGIFDSHIEAIGKSVVDASAKKEINNLHVMISRTIILPRGSRGEISVNSPSRLLMFGKFYLSFVDNELRYERPGDSSQGFFISDDVEVSKEDGNLLKGYRVDLFNKSSALRK